MGRRSRSRGKPQSWGLVLSALVLGGCASEHSVMPEAPGHLIVLELPPTPSSESLGRVLHNKHAASDQRFLAAARERINQELDASLRVAFLSEAAAPKAIDFEPFDQVGMAIGRPLEAATLTELQALQPADWYLRVSVTDYGETPRRWEGAYFAFEVVSTAAIAAALYVHTVTRPVAAAYVGEETVEEVSEGYAGFWALNRLSRPVRIEADMIDGRTGQVLFHESHTGLARWRWPNLWHMDDAARDALLDTSMRKAVAALADVHHQHSH
jgi:hypothetical protein